MTLTKDLVAASATPLVLAVLQRSDSYGYAIIGSVKAASGGEIEWSEGMLYPLLHRLAARGLIESYEAVSDAGRTRKFYRILPPGTAHLEQQSRDFDRVSITLAGLRGLTSGGPHVIA